MRILSSILLILFLLGITMLFHEPLREEGTLYSHFVLLIYLLYGLGGLGLLLKKYVYYQYADNLRVVFLNKRSGLADNLLFKIIAIALVALLNIALFNWGLQNTHSFYLLITTGIATLGVLLNIRPALVITTQGFYYDDYWALRWTWQEMDAIRFASDSVYIHGKTRDFEIELDLLQKANSLWSQLLQSDIQQFGDTPKDFQQWLYSFATAQGVTCNRPDFLKPLRSML